MKVLGVVLAFLLVLPAGAHAEDLRPVATPIPTITPEPEPEPEPKPKPPPAPAPAVIDAVPTGDSVTAMLGGPHHTNAVAGTIGTPLGLAWTAEVGANQLLAVPGTVLAIDHTGITALDSATGAKRWAISGNAFPPGAAIVEDTVVAMMSGGLTGYALADGAVRWTLPGVGIPQSPVPAGDLALVQIYGSRDSSIRAYEAKSGAMRWGYETPNPGHPAVVGDRVYVPGCGAGYAVLDRRDGRVINERASECSYGSASVAAAVGRMVRLDHGGAFETDSFGALPLVRWTAARPGLGLLTTGEAQLDGVDPVTGRQHWRAKLSQIEGTNLIAGDTAVVASRQGVVVLDGATGAERWAGRFAREVHTGSIDGRVPAIAALGSVFVVQEDKLHALRPGAAVPPARLTGSIEPLRVIEYGQALEIETALEQDPIMVERDIILAWKSAVSRRFKDRRIGRTKVMDLMVQAKLKPSLTTDYELSVTGASKGKRFAAVVIPNISERIRRGGADNNSITASVKLRVPKSIPLVGRRYGLYVGRAGRKRYQRIAVGTIQRTGRGRGRVTVRFRAPRVGGRDFFRFCVSGVSRRGMGFHDRLDRSCGAASVRF